MNTCGRCVVLDKRTCIEIYISRESVWGGYWCERQGAYMAIDCEGCCDHKGVEERAVTQRRRSNDR